MPTDREPKPLDFYIPVELGGGLQVECYPHDDIAGLVYVELSRPVRHPVRFWQRRREYFRLTEEQALALAQLVLRHHVGCDGR